MIKEDSKDNNYSKFNDIKLTGFKELNIDLSGFKNIELDLTGFKNIKLTSFKESEITKDLENFNKKFKNIKLEFNTKKLLDIK